MKYFLHLFFLIPNFIFLLLILINKEILFINSDINIFWITNINIPILTYIVIFYTIYIISIYVLIKFSNFFTWIKIKKDENIINKLKAKIADQIPEMNNKLNETYKEIITEFKDISSKNLELHKNQTKQVLKNLEFEINNLKDKIDTIKNADNK